MISAEAHLEIAGFLPDIQLTAVPSGLPVKLRPLAGKTSVLVAVHSAACPGCREYLQALASSSGEFDVWEARLLVAVPGPPEEASRLTVAFGHVLSDPGRQLAGPGSASVMVADRYGQIFHAAHAGASHRLPPVRELEEWLKYLGTLCPE